MSKNGYVCINVIGHFAVFIVQIHQRIWYESCVVNYSWKETNSQICCPKDLFTIFT